MLHAKDALYQESSELNAGRVFKLRSSSYISVGAEYYFAQVSFESGLFIREMRLKQPKSNYTTPPMGVNGTGSEAWESDFGQEGIDYFDSNIRPNQAEETSPVSGNCLLYFPSNRMEEPAWLNKSNLRTKVRYTEANRVKGETHRRIIAHSPLMDIHNWLFDVAYDRAVFEMNSKSINFPVNRKPGQPSQDVIPLPLFLGYQGDATNAYNAALAILQAVLPEIALSDGVRFGIGVRHGRVLSIEYSQGTVVPNVFQLSSGETALLSLFLSILRDFDLRENRNVPFSSIKDIRGLVVVDEIDLHLHSRHQHEVLPKLIHMFPRVQFVMTTHSPLFVLGMGKVFGKDGFDVYDLPTGSQVAVEEFDEFGDAFRAFRATQEFSDEIYARIQQSRQPLLYVEGNTDCDYLRRAADLLGKQDILAKFDMNGAGGDNKLSVIWKSLTRVPTATTKSVVLLYDPESQIQSQSKGSIQKRKMPFFDTHPIPKGIENLFGQEAIEKARRHCPDIIDTIAEHTKIVRGKKILQPETFSVNENEKRNLCNWLCKHGAIEDFRCFGQVFEILEDTLNSTVRRE